MSSYKTTNFGPIVSLQTSKADPRSNTTLTIDALSGVQWSGATSASLTSLTLPDGHLSIGSVSVTSATI
jgi:hypothetical protein